MRRKLWLGMLLASVIARSAEAAPCSTVGPNLVVDAITCQLSGVHTFTSVQIINGATIEVNPHDGSANKVATGNLELRAHTITIDATSKITAKGRGYQTRICGDGSGPATAIGTGDTFAIAAGVVTLTDAAGLFLPTQVGRTITIAGATTAANNGLFAITAVVSATQVRYANAAGVAQAFPGKWAIDDGSAGQGGCAVRDSGGGGAHFGRGGRGTNDISGTQTFPADFEEDCGNTVLYNASSVPSCSALGSPASTADCRTNDGLPTVAGGEFVHSIYQADFGASGGDKGCRDGDGTTLMTAGGGGGRIVLAGLDGGAGNVTINGTVDATGKRGCGIENDSGGGGAGGTIVVVGDDVDIGATAVITAAGGLGGDTQGGASGGECPAPFQQTGTCDDCGGGGGGGIVSVLSVTSTISDRAVFNVNGALGGVCPICNGEAGGGVGELQISNGFIGEFCDGFDNDFDGQVDENLGTLTCAASTVQACFGGVPQECPADVPACQAPVTDTRARFAVILDTSGSMLLTLPGQPTFGDGGIGHLGRDFDGNGLADDSRLFKAKSALTQVIAAYPSIDFALARYHQDTSVDRSCQLAHNFECNAICCSYDNPGNNAGPAPNPACTVNGGTSGPLSVFKDSPSNEECINYAGNCGPPRRGADILTGFGSDINNHLMWLDGAETQFDATATPGAFCNFAGGGDCELRGTGPTPLANSLQAIEDFLTPIKACDLAATGGCRGYNVILLTDGAESCQGNPVAAAVTLRNKGINTFVIGFSTLASEKTQLDAIAAAGGTGSAFLVGSEDALANALATIVSGSIVFETCNNLDDDCDSFVDEGFPGKGNACDNGQLGVCRTTGTLVCSGDGSGLTCNAPVGPSPGTETCNQLDDDCDGKIDEGLTGCICIAQGEQCDNDDDDCDGRIDEDITRPCGTGTCQGLETCTAGAFGGCTAQPSGLEVCNGLDDNCDGVRDGFTDDCSTMPPLPPENFPPDDPRNNPGHPSNTPIPQNICHPGTKTCPANIGPPNSFGACLGEVKPKPAELCNGLDDDCDNRIDEGTGGADCSSNCGVGTTVCVNGQLSCTAVPAASDDTCDGNDDDCDGNIDENYVCDDPPNCSCSGSGQCNAVQSCVNGAVVCQGQAISQESCDCSDNDCDGNTDEGSLCGAVGATCTNCQCAFACSPGEFPCPLGKVCKDNFCIADPCFGVACPPVGGNAQTCQVNDAGNQATCVDKCSVTTCAPLICIAATGECAPDDCRTFPDRCAATESCIVNPQGMGECIANPCAGVTCSSDTYCLGGNCVASCADVECPTGQRCRFGACEADPCGHACPFGQACNDATSECVTDICPTQMCPQGQWCDPSINGGTCASDPCVVDSITCPNPGEVCLGGTCHDPADLRPDAGVQVIVTTGGGGGCSTGGGAGLVIGVALLLVRRRRRA